MNTSGLIRNLQERFCYLGVRGKFSWVPAEREKRIQDAVVRGFTRLVREFPSSSWINDIEQPGFAMRYMYSRTSVTTKWTSCPNLYLALRRTLGPLNSEYRKRLILHGFDIPSSYPYPDSYYLYMTDLWRNATVVFRNELRNSF